MTDTRKQPNNEEPELGADESIPLDGKDPVGEKMIEELGRKSSTKEPDSDPDTKPGPLPEQLPVS